MRKAEVYRNGVLAGILTEVDDRTFEFQYISEYFNDNSKPAISLTLPKYPQTQTAWTEKSLDGSCK